MIVTYYNVIIRFLVLILTSILFVKLFKLQIVSEVCVSVVCWTGSPVEGLFLLLAVSTWSFYRGTGLEEIQKCWFPEQVCWKMWLVQPPTHKLNGLMIDLRPQQVAFPVDCGAQRCLSHWPPLSPKILSHYMSKLLLNNLRRLFWEATCGNHTFCRV